MRVEVEYELSEGHQGGACLHEFISHRSRPAPDRAALVQGAVVVTRGQLETLSNQLAHHLIDLGARAETLVGVCMERTPDMVVALLAILKAGAAYVPLDPTYPPARVNHILDDAGMQLVVTDQRSSPAVASVARHVICVDRQRAEIAAHPKSAPVSTACSQNLCYMIYTSGSTGLPKGSMNAHSAVVGTLLSLNELLELGASDRVLQVSSLNYDMSVYEVFGTLAGAGCVVLPQSDRVQDPGHLLELLEEQRVTIWSSAPPLFKAVVDHAVSHDRSLPSSMRAVILAGDRLPPALVATLAARAPSARLFNLAGMTENAVYSSAYEVRPGDHGLANIPWGRPLRGQDLHVLDEGLRAASAGHVGELYVAGGGVGRGYWRRPALTAERFVPDPFSPDPGARMYRTGDSVRSRNGDVVEFLGRLDHQVKVRGFRIELGEVEAVLGLHPRVRDVVAMARNDRPDDATLVVYVTSEDGNRIEPAALRTYTADRLPAYMIPSAVVNLERVPLLPNGKIDRGALPGPDSTAVVGEAERVPPRSALEQQVSDIWSEVMRSGPVSIEANFLDVGGHSVVALKIISRIQESFGVRLSLREFLESATVAGLARAITSRQTIEPRS